MHNVEEGEAGVQRRLPHQRQVQEVVRPVVPDGELVVVVAEQRGLYDFHELAQVLLVGGHRITLIAELLVGGVGGEEIDVGEVRGISLPQIGHQSAERREAAGGRLVRDEVAVERGVALHPRNEGVELCPARRIVQSFGGDQPVADLGTQPVPVGDVQLLFLAPGQVEAALGHLLCRGVGQRRAGPVGDDRRSHPPLLRPPAAGVTARVCEG